MSLAAAAVGSCCWQLLLAAAALLPLHCCQWRQSHSWGRHAMCLPALCWVLLLCLPASQAQPCSVSFSFVACAATLLHDCGRHALLLDCGRHEPSQLQLSGHAAICDPDAHQGCSCPCIRMDAWWEPAS